MKSKAPLVMMEQIIMVLVFALASALCLQTFVLSGKIAQKTEAQTRAAMKAQNVAESIKAQGLDRFLQEQNPEQIKEGFRLSFDGKWNVVTEENQTRYYLDICPENSDGDFLWKIQIIVAAKDGTELFRIPVAGQVEVMRNE